MIYLMRHGADPSDRLGGWSTDGLTEAGRSQVHEATTELRGKGITKICASDLTRARETAEIIADELGLEIEYMPEFRESNNGLLAGMPKTEAAQKYPGIYWNALDWTECWPGGESPEQFYKRIKEAWSDFKQQVGTEPVLLVSHGGVMNIILCLENEIPYTNKETHFKIKDAEIIQIANITNMKHICELNDQIILGQGGRSSKVPRLTARAIVKNQDGLYAVMYAEKFGLHSLPGGGIENGEDALTALRREVYEETGCTCDDIQELGIVYENRASLDYTQINYYYVVSSADAPGENHLTDAEKASRTIVEWYTLDEMTRVINKQEFERIQQKYLKARDVAALQEYRQYLT